MSLTNMQVFQEYVKTTASEMIAQEVQKFNAASAGAITLVAANHDGDYSEASKYAKIPGLVRRRDAYGSGAVSAVPLQQLLDRSVKVAAGTPPITIDPNMFNWINKSPEEAGVVIGSQLAGDMLGDMLNTALLAAVPVITANASLTNNIVAATPAGTADKASPRALNRTAQAFGDRSQQIVAWIMHSGPMHDLYDNALANSEQLFEFGNVQIRQDGFGRVLVMTDSPALTVSGTPDTHVSLGLVNGGIYVGQNDDFFDNMETENGDENIGRTYQAEWSYNLGLKGYTYDSANGGRSPNNTALGTASNWDQHATSIKDVAGVALITDAES